ncbi:TNT domain-containing protein [Kutzneria sp. 744]|uniref:TNT domain-containing protein n=1 Tax=Kutzneria sp. (strain 744) TaxID=345341 RepID=UPI00069377DA|nr:TNT domain-containing protein [Kutzneria sp. 744]
MSKINTRPGHLRKSGGKLSAFGGKLADGGQKLESTGQDLVSHASNDRSGIGAVVAKAMGKGVQVTGKVFNEGGRVAEGAGKRLGATADLYEEADGKGAGLLRKFHPDSKDVAPKGGHGSPSTSRGHSNTTPGHTTPKHHTVVGGSHAEEQWRLREQHGEPKPDSDWLADADDVKHRRHPGLKPGDPKFEAVTHGRQPPTGTELDRFNSKWSQGRDPNSGFENYQYPTEEYGHPNGFATPQDKRAEWVPPGTRIDRFGSEYGSFLATEGAPWPERALPPHTLTSPYHTYEVTQPFPSWVGPAAGWFDQPGGATQYFLGQYDVDRLLKAGYLRETTGE